MTINNCRDNKMLNTLIVQSVVMVHKADIYSNRIIKPSNRALKFYFTVTLIELKGIISIV